MDQLPPNNAPLPSETAAAAATLRATALVVSVLIAGTALTRLFLGIVESSTISLRDFAELAIGLALAALAGGLLLGLSAILRALAETRSGIRANPGSPSSAVPPLQQHELDPPTRFLDLTTAQALPANQNQPNHHDLSEILRVLEDIRDNSLLSDDERCEKRRRVADDELQEAQAVIRLLIGRGEFAQARQVAEKRQQKYPADERAAALVRQVEDARERGEVADVNGTIKQVDDLISISAWPRARELAQQLQQRHPDSVAARQLLIRIEREHQTAQDEQRRRMYAEIQRGVTRRRWEEALVAARTFIERFPGCEESAALCMKLPTLETNAEIEVRQQLEARIMDFAKHGRYLEAVELARKVIEKYPTSPQAEALRVQLPRLEELANNPEALPARLRLDD